MEENSLYYNLKYWNRKSLSSDLVGTLAIPRKRALDRLVPQTGKTITDSFNNRSRGALTKPRVKESWTEKKVQEREMARCDMFGGRKYFSMCISCFWCASFFKGLISFTSCPLCNEGKIDCMPIGEDENYRVNITLTKGIVMEFSDDIQALTGQ